MKYLIFTLTLTIISIALCGAQSFENKKILTTSFNEFRYSFNESTFPRYDNPAFLYRSLVFRMRPQITFGKVNNRNELYAYGIGLDYRSYFIGNNDGIYSRNTRFGASPMMVIQKFIRLSKVFYLSPSLVATGGYVHDKWSNNQINSYQIRDQYHASLALIPVSVTYSFDPRINLVFSMGQISLSYLYSTQFTRAVDGDFETKLSRFNYFGGITRLSFGFQLLL